MKAQINPAQYELVFTQVLDGPLLNHRNLPITNVHFGSREKVHKTIPFSEFKKIEEECQRRVEFKKEQLEFERKRKSEVYQENLNDIQQALAFQMVVVSDLAKVLV